MASAVVAMPAGPGNPRDRESQDFSGLRFGNLPPSKPDSWLWTDMIPLGGFTLLYGDGGCGKSTLTRFLMAGASRGWIPGNFKGRPKTSVLVSNGEDSKDKIFSQYKKMGGDTDDVHDRLILYSTAENCKNPLKIAMEAIANPGLSALEDCGLMVIDPVDQFIGDLIQGPSADSNRSGDVQSMISQLNAFAQQHNMTIIGIAHIGKRIKGGKHSVAAKNASLGSIQWKNTARSAILMARFDDHNEPYSYITSMKVNGASAGAKFKAFIDTYDPLENDPNREAKEERLRSLRMGNSFLPVPENAELPLYTFIPSENGVEPTAISAADVLDGTVGPDGEQTDPPTSEEKRRKLILKRLDAGPATKSEIVDYVQTALQGEQAAQSESSIANDLTRLSSEGEIRKNPTRIGADKKWVWSRVGPLSPKSSTTDDGERGPEGQDESDTHSTNSQNPFRPVA